MTVRIHDEPHDGGFTRYYGPNPPKEWRAKAILRQANSSEWTMDIATRTGHDRQGHGTDLIETIREWAADHGYTVRTSNAMPDAYGFYEKCGCRQIVDGDGDIEYMVAPR